MEETPLLILAIIVTIVICKMVADVLFFILKEIFEFFERHQRKSHLNDLYLSAIKAQTKDRESTAYRRRLAKAELEKATRRLEIELEIACLVNPQKTNEYNNKFISLNKVKTRIANL